MREGVSLTICDSRVLGETRRVIICGYCMLKSQEKRVVLELCRDWKTKGKEYKISKGRLGLGLGGLLSWIGPKRKRNR